MIKLSDIRKGSIVIVRGDFGRGEPQQVTIDGIDEEGKNGYPVISYKGVNVALQEQLASWAYLDQVAQVITY